MKILVTGGAGFIGSAVTRSIIHNSSDEVLVFDKLTYAGNLSSLKTVMDNPRFSFIKGDISDRPAVDKVLCEFQPQVVMNLAAESHVDRSIDGPAAFIETNLVGTFVLLQSTLDYWRKLDRSEAHNFRLMHVSTDEVYGSLGIDGFFHEESPYRPTSPYSASKAGSDHLVRAWYHTYGLPTIITNCSNNYGPYHFPEKLIPLMIINAIEDKPLPVYGRGLNVRDWLYVDDHAAALRLVAQEGKIGDSYNVGGGNERRNIDVVYLICDLLNELLPHNINYRELIEFVDDRPGHDLRYAIDSSKIQKELKWEAIDTFDTGLRKTVMWYLNHRDWWLSLRSTKYQGQRLGLSF